MENNNQKKANNKGIKRQKNGGKVGQNGMAWLIDLAVHRRIVLKWLPARPATPPPMIQSEELVYSWRGTKAG